MSYEGDKIGVDLEKHPNAKSFVERCKQFINEVQNL
jgi:hypothetical protein